MPHEALAWLEYCNSDDKTYYANLRRANGREKAYGVKYWALGNEVWGPWFVTLLLKVSFRELTQPRQVEQMTKEDYAKKAKQWAKGLYFPT